MFQLPKISPSEILIYLRKSRTDDPTLSVAETLAKHEQMLNEWCEKNLGNLVPEHNRFREVVSGETIDARPEIQKFLRLIESPQYKAVLIVEPQRLSRGDLEDIGRLTKLLRYTGTLIITLQYTYDLTDERDRDFFERELKRGNEFLEYQKRIMGNGRVLSAENGSYLGSIPPYGYERTVIREGKRRVHTLAVKEDEAEIVRQIFRMYAGGSGATMICKHLNSLGVKTQKGAQWTPPTIYDMLDNPVYIGLIKWQERKTVKEVRAGEIVVRNPRQKSFRTFPGKHPAIIEESLWNAVADRRAARTIPRVNVTGELRNPLSGLMRCSCGHYMIRKPFGGRCADRLQCPNMTYCGNASCTMDEITDGIKRILQMAIADFRVKIQQGAAADLAAYDAYRQQLADRLAELDAKELTLWEKYTEGMPKHIFDSLLKKNQEEKEQTAEQLRNAEQKEPHRIDYAERCRTFQEAVDILNDESAEPQQQNDVLKRCSMKFIYHRTRGTRGKSSGTSRRGWNMQPLQLDTELSL